MSLPDKVSRETRWVGLRAPKRLNARIPIAIEWEENGKTFRKEGNTVDVSHYDCLVVGPQDLSLDLRLRVTNLISNQSSEAVIVWKGGERSEGWEVGMVLIEPDPDFWGLEI
jgi:hypothetical protein